MRCLVVVVIVVLVKCPTSKAHDDKTCSRRSDCAPNQYCINNDCTEDKPSDYCDEGTLCHAGHYCEDNKCIKYCHCDEHGEECVNGECVNAVKNAFTPAVIACLVVGAPILGCILCAIYCRCFRRANRRATQQQELELATLRQEASLESIPDAGPTGEPGIHPGGPPPYHSLERIDRETPAPPSYEEDPNQQLRRNDTIGERPPPTYEELATFHSSERTGSEVETHGPPSYEDALQNSYSRLDV